MSVALPVLVTSLDPDNPYSEHCITFVVNRHGCGLRAPRPLGPKTPVRLDIGSGKRSATAHVVMCAAIRDKKDLWELGIELDVAENLWGFHFPPPDWIAPTQAGVSENPSEESPPAQPAAAPAPVSAPSVHVQTPAVPPQAVAATQQPSVSPPLASPPTLSLPAATLGVSAAAAQAPVVAQMTEVTISLSELETELGVDLAPPPSPDVAGAPKEEVETPSTIRPHWQGTPEQSDQDLRERARRISAEFEEDYRRSLGELLARLRADLEGQATDDWNRVLRQAEESLQVRVAEQSSLLQQERVRQDEAQALLNARLAELQKLRDYVESLLRAAPQALQHHLQEGAAQTLAEIRTRLEQELAASAETQAKQLEQHVQAGLAQAAQEARQALLDDFDRHEREFLDRIAVRLEDVRASADHTREFAKRASADMARQSEQQRVDLQTQFDSLFEQQRQDLARRLEERHQQLSQAAHTALQNLGGRLWGSLRQHLSADFETRTRELQQSLRTAQAETRHLREHTEKLVARLDTDLEARLDQAVEGAIDRARNQLQQLLTAAREEGRQQLEAEREQSRTRHEQIEQALTESLRAQRAALLAEFQRQAETAAADCLAQSQAVLGETLESFAEVLRTKLRLPRQAS